MKYILVFALIVLASCTKQASNQLATEEETKANKGKPSTQATASLETLSNPAPNTLQWTVPALTGDEVYIGFYVEWGNDVSGIFQKVSGFKIFKLAKPNTTPITSWVQGTDGWFVPSGNWSMRISGTIATPNPLAGTMFLLGSEMVWQPDYINDRQWQTNVLPNVIFN